MKENTMDHEQTDPKGAVSSWSILFEIYLSHDFASASDITPCNKIDKPLVVYRFSGNVMTSIITFHNIRDTLGAFTPKMQFLSV